MVLSEIHQRFKGHFLNELRVSFEKPLERQEEDYSNNYIEYEGINDINKTSSFNQYFDEIST